MDLNRLFNLPPWRRYLIALVALLVIIYLIWSFWPRKTIPAGVMTQAKPAIKQEKITVQGPQVIRVIEKQVVYKQLPTVQIAPSEQVLDTAIIPAAPNGAITVTTIDQQTGEARTQYELKKAPWFALERGNELGLSYGLTTEGRQTACVHYRRDLFRVKDVHISGQVAVDTEFGGEAKGRALIQANWRF